MLQRLLLVLAIASVCRSEDYITWFPTRVVSIEYPLLGVQSRTHGVVKIECVLSPNGSVSEAKILSGSLLLGKAVLDRISEWRFRSVTSAAPTQPPTLILTFNFLLEDQAATVPKTKFVYDYPNTITVISQPFARSH
jgi:TonB family protein